MRTLLGLLLGSLVLAAPAPVRALAPLAGPGGAADTAGDPQIHPLPPGGGVGFAEPLTAGQPQWISLAGGPPVVQLTLEGNPEELYALIGRTDSSATEMVLAVGTFPPSGRDVVALRIPAELARAAVVELELLTPSGTARDPGEDLALSAAAAPTILIWAQGQGTSTTVTFLDANGTALLGQGGTVTGGKNQRNEALVPVPANAHTAIVCATCPSAVVCCGVIDSPQKAGQSWEHYCGTPCPDS